MPDLAFITKVTKPAKALTKPLNVEIRKTGTDQTKVCNLSGTHELRE
jgi:hypothetical protein